MTSQTLLIIFLLITFKIKNAEAPKHADFWIAWNIGQGQWITHILTDSCRHFDAGGELGSFKRIKKNLLNLCGQKNNRLFLSHWDFDHFSNIVYLARNLPKLCWEQKPPESTGKVSAQKAAALSIPFCATDSNKVQTWKPNIKLNTNESSFIFQDNGVLLPGDSTLKQENIWSQQLSLTTARILILGHHGSKTSTGNELLQRLPALSWALASARYAKYHHPHPQTLKRLYERGVPLLKTEDWGNIWFQP